MRECVDKRARVCESKHLVCSVAVAGLSPSTIPHLPRTVTYYGFVPLCLKLTGEVRVRVRVSVRDRVWVRVS